MRYGDTLPYLLGLGTEYRVQSTEYGYLTYLPIPTLPYLYLRFYALRVSTRAEVLRKPR
jgi:hypothetical protein